MRSKAPSRSHHEVPADSLRERYEELRALRETQPEKEAAAARKALDKSREASELLVAALRAEVAKLQEKQPPVSVALEELRAENAALRTQLATANAAAASAASSAAAPSSSSSSSSATLEAKVAFYALMTGMSVELAAGDVFKCVVTCTPPAGEDQENAEPTSTAAAVLPPKPRRAEFELRLLSPENGEPGDVEYAPIDLSGCADAKLPSYLKEEIEFERDSAPGFLQRLLAGVAGD